MSPGTLPDKSPEGFDALLDALGRDLEAPAPGMSPGAPDEPERLREIENLTILINMADGYPEAWARLRRFIGEQAMTYAGRNMAVQTAKDPVASHAERCYNGGAGEALAWLAWFLSPERLHARMKSIAARGRVKSVTEINPEKP